MVEGIKIVEDILEMAGVETPEGCIVPQLMATRGSCHAIHMLPGMYCDEHPHPTESLIYTVRGKWTLCSQGQRWVMNAGSLFWFGENVPTGYETPFGEEAYILIFKPYPPEWTREEFLSRLHELARKLEESQAKGAAFLFSDLPEDHPARLFARQHGGVV